MEDIMDNWGEVAIKRIRGEIVDCGICHKPILYKYSHNAYPVSDKRCCESCNYEVVLPERMKQANPYSNI